MKLFFEPTYYQVSVLKLFFEGLLLLHFPRLQRRYGRKSFSTLYIAFLLFYGLNGLTFFPTCYIFHSSFFFLIRIEGGEWEKERDYSDIEYGTTSTTVLNQLTTQGSSPLRIQTYTLSFSFVKIRDTTYSYNNESFIYYVRGRRTQSRWLSDFVQTLDDIFPFCRCK